MHLKGFAIFFEQILARHVALVVAVSNSPIKKFLPLCLPGETSQAIHVLFASGKLFPKSE